MYLISTKYTYAINVPNIYEMFIRHKCTQISTRSTRKPVGFMQSCCFVFVGILSTYK